MDPSPQFLLLAATLLDSALDNDTVLLQLHSVFGPMLMSALRLVDRREVVHIDLGGRGMHQVSSSSGAPYTLYLNLPDLPPKPPKESSEEPKEGSGDVEEAGEDAALARQAAESEAVRKAKADNNARLRINAERLRHMYCPCTSWAFNALDGRQIFCKHVLAVLLAHRLGRVVETRVGLHAAAGLLGIQTA